MVKANIMMEFIQKDRMILTNGKTWVFKCEKFKKEVGIPTIIQTINNVVLLVLKSCQNTWKWKSFKGEKNHFMDIYHCDGHLDIMEGIYMCQWLKRKAKEMRKVPLNHYLVEKGRFDGKEIKIEFFGDGKGDKHLIMEDWYFWLLQERIDKLKRKDFQYIDIN